MSRYYKTSQSPIIDYGYELPYAELFTQLQQKQSLQDQRQSMTDALPGLANFEADLAPDKAFREQFIKDIDNTINTYATKDLTDAATFGALRQEINRFKTDPRVNQVRQNTEAYRAALKYRRELEKKQGNLMDYQRFPLDQSIFSYNQQKQVGNFNPSETPGFTDISEKLEKFVSSYKANGYEVRAGSSGGYQIYDKRTGITNTEATRALTNFMSNPMIQNQVELEGSYMFSQGNAPSAQLANQLIQAQYMAPYLDKLAFSDSDLSFVKDLDVDFFRKKQLKMMELEGDMYLSSTFGQSFNVEQFGTSKQIDSIDTQIRQLDSIVPRNEDHAAQLTRQKNSLKQRKAIANKNHQTILNKAWNSPEGITKRAELAKKFDEAKKTGYMSFGNKGSILHRIDISQISNMDTDEFVNQITGLKPMSSDIQNMTFKTDNSTAPAGPGGIPTTSQFDISGSRMLSTITSNFLPSKMEELAGSRASRYFTLQNSKGERTGVHDAYANLLLESAPGTTTIYKNDGTIGSLSDLMNNSDDYGFEEEFVRDKTHKVVIDFGKENPSETRISFVPLTEDGKHHEVIGMVNDQGAMGAQFLADARRDNFNQAIANSGTQVQRKPNVEAITPRRELEIIGQTSPSKLNAAKQIHQAYASQLMGGELNELKDAASLGTDLGNETYQAYFANPNKDAAPESEMIIVKEGKEWVARSVDPIDTNERGEAEFYEVRGKSIEDLEMNYYMDYMEVLLTPDPEKQN